MKVEKEFLKQNYGAKLSALSKGKEYVTLETANSEDDAEFSIYGNRLVAWLVDRFKKYSTSSDIRQGTILEIGCGMGRLLKPLSCHFKWIIGVDMSREILEEADNYLRDTPNKTLLENDGLTLADLASNSVEYVLCTGVMQHIPYRRIISDYICEAIRVLHTGGLFQFSFQVWQTELIGRKRVGAKITAEWLDEITAELPVQLLEITSDPQDPLPHFTVIFRKTESHQNFSFSNFPITEVRWRTVCWQDLHSMSMHRKLQKEGQRKITFFQ